MRRVFIYVKVLFFALILTSCGSSKKEVTVNIGTNDWPGYETLYIAEESGSYSDSNVRMVEFGSASEVIRAYKNGLIEMAALTLDEVLLLREEGYRPVVIAVLDISHGGDAVISQKEIKDFKGLKGKKIGFEGTALGAYVLTRALQKNSMQESDIKTVYIEFSEHETAFLNKSVDAVVTFEPARSHLIAKGGNILFDSQEIPGEVVDVLVVKEEFLKENRNVVSDVIAGWKSAYEKLKSQPLKTAAMVSQKYNMSAEEFLNSLEGLKLPDIEENLKMMQDDDDSKLMETAERLYEVMRDKNHIKREFGLDGMIDCSFIREKI